MSKGQKIITIGLWAVLLLAIVGAVAGKFLLPRLQHPAAPALPVYYPAARFALTDQNAKPFSSDDLRGRPWVAAFIFTNCAGVCPQMTTTMARIQGGLPREAHLVSFSVDPERDTPQVLKEYADTYKADPVRWHFLTGTKDQMFAAAADMKLAAEPGDAEHAILHSPKLVLIDAEGNIRGYYNGTKPDEVTKLVKDAGTLAK